MKRLFSFFLCVCFLLSLSGCFLVSDKPPLNNTENTVTDGSGAALKIPENKSETTIASVYAVAVPFFAALRLCERVTAVNVKSTFWTDACEGLASAGSVGRGAVDLEALAKLSPDALVHRCNDSATVEAVTNKLGIPVLCVAAEDFEGIIDTLDQMGAYFGREERAKEVCAWLYGKFEKIDAVVASIPQSERVTALMMGGELGRVAGKDMLQSRMIEMAGGVCVCADAQNNRSWINIGVESVFERNPEYIFCTSSTPLDYTVAGLLLDPAWSAVSAVKNKNVYIVPANADSWDLPGISCVIGTMYMLHRMYPDYFSAEQLQSEIDEYYMFMFGKTFDSAYLGYDLGS